MSEDYKNFIHLWRKNALFVIGIALWFIVSVFVAGLIMGLIVAIVSVLFDGYELNAEIILGILLLIIAPYNLGIIVEIMKGYPRKKEEVT